MTTARLQTFAGVIESKLYVVGWYTTAITAVNEEYNPVTNTWASKASMNTAKRAWASAVLDWELYCIGWTNATVNLNNVQKYNTTTNSWTTLNNSLCLSISSVIDYYHNR